MSILRTVLFKPHINPRYCPQLTVANHLFDMFVTVDLSRIIIHI